MDTKNYVSAAGLPAIFPNPGCPFSNSAPPNGKAQAVYPAFLSSEISGGRGEYLN